VPQSCTRSVRVTNRQDEKARPNPTRKSEDLPTRVKVNRCLPTASRGTRGSLRGTERRVTVSAGVFMFSRRVGRVGFAVAPGFSLVELLAVIAVIGLLAALLMPAVERARETSRRMACLNNLHQMGLGILAFHDAFQRFPEGGVEYRMLRGSDGKLRWPSGRQLAWSAYILPYVELQSLARRIDFSKAFDSPENAAVAAQLVPLYLCPSVPRKSYLVRGRGACDYGGIYGERIASPNEPPKGVMLYGEYVRMRDIIDGSAHTVMVSEDSGWPEGQWINGANVFDQGYAINKAPSFENDMRSKHPGGVNGLFADGNARFLSENMDLKILAAICTRAGREPLGEF
jgi:prepilin-type N-terminal cleavage/methylation domain-containing protein/prepilin-type processing-associated H-X9-DG protein